MNKTEHCTFQLKTVGKTWNLRENQSPRGLRHENKRPDLIVIDCYKVASKKQLRDFINYLIELENSMS